MEFVTLFLSRSGRAQEAPPKGRGKRWAKYDNENSNPAAAGAAASPDMTPKILSTFISFAFTETALPRPSSSLSSRAVFFFSRSMTQQTLCLSRFPLSTWMSCNKYKPAQV